ncbi:PepSY domain-containing protein [Butyrivibrio sp. VCD2006]|uniref:PepSY domain-containing protein n=1 Tax=Butyrivibrio sp. VCD2006 TaxID=1280664 RepID=UPI0004126C9C|nr:PepSY domain-containing protein [Butyrivibrio sp. VCD2006]
MKKNTITTAIAFAVAFITFAASSMTASASYIPMEDARTIATGNACVKQEEVVFTSEETEVINGIAQYDLTFRKGNQEYEYVLNANTGEVLLANITVIE